jgi:SEC-C motif domain protein
MKTLGATAPCPCGGTRYASCCGSLHTGAEPAPTAERLMRSRYSAYTLEHGEYLLATWHPSTRPSEPPHFEPGLKWLGLEVREHRLIGADRAEVLFVARSKLGGRAHRLVERSRFLLEGGRWCYLDGDVF